MNTVQMALQLRKALRDAAWPDGGEVVFGTDGCWVMAETPTEEQIPSSSSPWCIVQIADGTPDEDHPELIQQNFQIVFAQQVGGDPRGENAIVGGPIEDLTKSASQGIGSIETCVREAVGDLVGSDGAKVIVSASAGAASFPVGRQQSLAARALTVTATCTAHLHYAAPQELAESAGSWSWAFEPCVNRFDFVQYRFGHLTGSTPSPSVSAYTVIYTGTVATTAHTPVSGRVYAVWADYNLRRPDGQTTVVGSSAPDEVGAYVVVP